MKCTERVVTYKRRTSRHNLTGSRTSTARLPSIALAVGKHHVYAISSPEKAGWDMSVFDERDLGSEKLFEGYNLAVTAVTSHRGPPFDLYRLR